MKIVFTSPFVWPWVRRGSERMLHDLTRYFAGRGHEVSVFSTAPQAGIEQRDGIAYHLLQEKYGARLRQFNCCHHFAFQLQEALAAVDPDLVVSMNYFDAYAAIRARQRRGARYKVIFHSAGILSRRHFLAVPLDAWFFYGVVRRQADLTLVVSRSAGERYAQEFGVEPVALPPPIVIESFRQQATALPEGASQRRVLFASDADDPRKGARLLCRAFVLVKKRFPDAHLVFAGRASERTRQALVAECAPLNGTEHITFLGVGKVEDLPALYQSAAVTVLPSVAEAFGMVLVESLAAGTPVVGTRDGGIREIIVRDDIGRMFDPGAFKREASNVVGLADAINAVLDRGKPASVVDACRAHAEQYSWELLGPEYERLLHQLVSNKKSRRAHAP